MVSVELFNNLFDFFDNSVIFDELIWKGVSNLVLFVMVLNVVYGRMIYVKLEIIFKSKDV